MKVHVVTFGTEPFAGSVAELRRTALSAGGADFVHAFDERDVRDFFADRPELLERSRGFGWWSWKPFLLSRVAATVPDGDVVVWLDSCMCVMSSLRPHAQALEASGAMAAMFRLGGWQTTDHSIGAWTSRRALRAMGVPDPVRRFPMVNAAVQMYRACKESREFLGEYTAWCTRLDVVADDEDENGDRHRHDQSVLSVMVADRMRRQVAGGGGGGAEAVLVWRDPTQFGVNDPEGPGPRDPAAMVLEHHRKLLPLGQKVAVVTAAVGGPHLAECVRSVQAQTYNNVEHWVIIDGPEFEDAVRAVTDRFVKRTPMVVVTLPRNTGAGGWNGHRIYGAASHLVDAPLLTFLDEDNMIDVDHVESLVHALASGMRLSGARWAHSLRRIVDRDGAAVCNDTCESLGGICHTCLGPEDRLVDTSCYLLPRELAVDVSPCWNVRARCTGRLECDRALATVLLTRVGQGACTRRHTLAYRTGSTARSVQTSFFLENDKGYDFKAKTDVYIFHFGAEQTRQYFERRLAWLRGAREPWEDELEEWQMTLWRGLEDSCNVMDGFANQEHIPHGAVCLVAMCHPDELPLDFLRRRRDLVRVCYTIESPNIRHAAQWDITFLTTHFDRILTYWKDVLRLLPEEAVYCPHNTHHIDLLTSSTASARSILRTNLAVGDARRRSACMVLARRLPPMTHDQCPTYKINGTTLRCLDGLREVYVDGMRDVTVFGMGWNESDVVRRGRARLGHAKHRSEDPYSSVDIMRHFTFAIIVENTDAEGYASEKLYDALIAGCIPLYYGSAPDFVPRNLYVDLKKFEDGAAVQAYLDTLDDEVIDAWKKRITSMRIDVLRHVSVQAFADTVAQTLRSVPSLASSTISA
jgi:hypothetical protein